jgi:short subunit dehydrogenase-like uncharacterized protein
MIKKILLLGAYGYTARLIAKGLASENIHFSIAGKNREKLVELQNKYPQIISFHEVDIDFDEQLDTLIPGFDLLINCIGPYNLYGQKVLEKCIQEGICYLDICGEQYFVQQSMMKYHQKAIDSGASIFHAIAFESALVDLLAKVKLPQNTKWKEISSVYYFEKSRPSPGTRLSIQTSPYFPTYCLNNNSLKETGISAYSKKVYYPDKPDMDTILFAPYPEILFFQRTYAPQCSASYVLTSRANANYAIQDKGVRPLLQNILEQNKRRLKTGPEDTERQNQFFEIVLFAEENNGKKYSLALTGYDMYGITASIVIIYCKELLNHGIIPKGILCPSDIGLAKKVFEEIISINQIKISENLTFRILDE